MLAKCFKLLTALALAGVLTVPAGAQEKSANYLPPTIQDGVILHCFAWPLRDVIEELPAIAEAGFCAVQLSPMQAPNVAGQPWYYTYGPCDYRFYESVIGTRADLIELCAKAEELGIKIVMDIAANHLIHDKEDAMRAPLQYTDPWWFEDDRCVRLQDQGNITWDSRWSFTHQNIFGNEIKTDRADVQQRMREYLDDLWAMGVRGIRWDSCKHIGVPSEGDDFWKGVLEGRDELWTYGEILGGIDYAPELLPEYAEYMSMTDAYTDHHGQYNALHWQNIPRTRCVFWAESHDMFSNDETGTRALSQEDIDRTWALAAARQGATALYFSRPSGRSKNEIKLAVKGSTNFKNPEVAEVNKFHNLMGNLPEDYAAAEGYTAIYRQKGVVIVADREGEISVPVRNLMSGQNYVDHISGSTFTITGDKLVGTVGPKRIAVVYDPDIERPRPYMEFSPGISVFSDESVTLLLTTHSTDKGSYSVNGAPRINFTRSTHVTVGEGLPNGSEITIDWTAGDGDQAVSGSYILTKREKIDTYVYLRSDVDFSSLNVNCFIYGADGSNNAGWPGLPMDFDASLSINGKSGWWTYSVPQEFTYGGYAMVNTSGSYRFPADGVPGIPLEGKSLAFEYNGGKWTYFVPETVAGLPSAPEADEQTPVRYYTITGRQLTDVPTDPGLYIAVSATGATRKIIIR